MRVTVLLFASCLAVAAALPPAVRIAGGSNAAITSYRFAASLLYSRVGVGTFIYGCGGSIITNRVILTAAYCLHNEPVYRWRVRVGSARSSTGGVVHNTLRTVVHPNYNPRTADSDIALLHSMTVFVFNNNVNLVGIASANYNLPDNQPVTAIGWGATSHGGQLSDTLRRVDIWTVNRNVCRTRHSELGYSITDNMLCAGWLDVGGRGACIGDTGSALIHLNRNVQTIVGVYSWSYNCALPRYPSVNTFVPRFTNWIVANAN
ncbi:trypsin CFT-1-like [Danaus plexippus]|uniref:Trypsin n=1 Tax=Danaus plexippus plexippus TaxID=278856 RepID=A0A212EX43_DANPL|nr:trypsin CFT-1-like [Danaus plexippus]OWR46055.1 trypsin [Danaus plexippus plexippus]